MNQRNAPCQQGTSPSLCGFPRKCFMYFFATMKNLTAVADCCYFSTAVHEHRNRKQRTTWTSTTHKLHVLADRRRVGGSTHTRSFEVQICLFWTTEPFYICYSVGSFRRITTFDTHALAHADVQYMTRTMIACIYTGLCRKTTRNPTRRGTSRLGTHTQTHLHVFIDQLVSAADANKSKDTTNGVRKPTPECACKCVILPQQQIPRTAVV